MAGLIGFPDPVDETSARVVATGVVGMTAAIVLHQPSEGTTADETAQTA